MSLFSQNVDNCVYNKRPFGKKSDKRSTNSTALSDLPFLLKSLILKRIMQTVLASLIAPSSEGVAMVVPRRGHRLTATRS